MQSDTSPERASSIQWRPAVLMVVCLSIILAALFYKSFDRDTVVFSNDGPLGVQNLASLALPEAWFKGVWYQTWIGASGSRANVSVTEIFRWLTSPVGFSKFYEPVSLLFLGICAWIFFRTMSLRSSLCLVGAIAAALNSNFFSNVCWGLGSRAITLGCTFLALAALSARRIGNPWLNAALAGLAVGMSVVEGADNGAIFSLCVSAFVVFQSFVEARSIAGRVARSLRIVLVAAFAVFIALQSLSALFGFAQTGTVTEQADEQTREAKWNFATQWSLPPKETARVIIPGLFGYRMDRTLSGTETVYWGRVGEAPEHPELLRRFSGSGEYAGLLVVLLAIWSIAASFSRSLNVFSSTERMFVWFWTTVAIICVLLSWGRFAPFYQFVYALPYFSSIRNPMKFMHVTHMALMILFGYGLLGLSRRYLERASPSLSIGAQLKSWWSKAASFDRRWTWVLVSAVVVSMILYVLYGGSREALVKHLTEAGFPDTGLTAGLAGKIAGYSIREAGLFVVWLVISGAALMAVIAGVFAGKRAPWAALLLGVALTADLARANKPWIVFWNYPYKYGSNPVIDVLRQKPFEGRVVSPPFLMDDRALSAAGGMTYLFPSLYAIEWVQHHFLYYNIQTLDVAQDPRPPADKAAYLRAMRDPGRYWQLTNSRYILGLTGFLDALNTQLAKGRNSFRVVTTFDVQPKPGVQPLLPADLTAVAVNNGPLALFEYADALPRTKLYSQWQVSTDDEKTLQTLADPSFDPWKSVIVSDEITVPTLSTNGAEGTSEIVAETYKPQHVEIRASAPVPSVLLLNDRFDHDWRVSVDGQPAKMLRCNFIMRGVQIPAGEHRVVFTMEPDLGALKISLVAIGLGFVLCVLLLFVRQTEIPVPAPVSSSTPAPKPSRKQK
jgi:hypothetical protein